MKALGKEELIDDPRFNSLENLLANVDAYREVLSEAFLSFTTEDILQKLMENDVPCAKCLSHEEVLSQPQLGANNSIEVYEHPLMGSMRIMKAPPRFGGEVLEPGGPSPAHGEHTDAVLTEFGLDGARLESMKERGIIA